MKSLLFAVVIGVWATANAEGPKCEKGRWNSDSFMLFTGGENCDSRVIACNFLGTRSEGWYSYAQENEMTLQRGNCALTGRKPECVDLDDGKEGWLVNNRVRSVERCSDMDVVCSYKGTDQEGWYAYPVSDRRIVTYASCAEE